MRKFFFQPMRGLGSGHVTCGPMRGLKKNGKQKYIYIFFFLGQVETFFFDMINKKYKIGLSWEHFFQPMRGLGSGHVTCGPIRGLEKNGKKKKEKNLVELRFFFFWPMRGLGSGHVTFGPMRGLTINFTQTDRETDRHFDSLTESAQWADSLKITEDKKIMQLLSIMSMKTKDDLIK